MKKPPHPNAAAWAASVATKWPQISVANTAEFKGHTALNAGNAFFIRTRSGNILGATARHLLGPAGGVDPILKLTDLDASLKKWELTSRTAPPKVAHIRGLHGSPLTYGALDELILLKVAPEDTAKLPSEALAPRLTVVKKDEIVYLVGTGVSGSNQEIHRAKVTIADGLIIDAKLEKPIDLTGFSGSPVVDSNGSLIGVLTSSHAKPDRQGNFASFIAESVIQVRNLVR